MQTALLTLALLGVVAVVIGGVIAVLAMRNAPEGYEDANGFHTVPANGTSALRFPSDLPSSRDDLSLAA